MRTPHSCQEVLEGQAGVDMWMGGLDCTTGELQSIVLVGTKRPTVVRAV
jgi:hypothetical protein